MKNLYEDFANKAAAIIGFDKTDCETFERSKQGLFENNLNGAESLKDYLSYRYFDPKTESFLLAGSSAGFLLEICPLVGVETSVVKNLNQFFAKELPVGGFLQFFLLASSDIEDFLRFWGNGRVSSDPVLQRITTTSGDARRLGPTLLALQGPTLPALHSLASCRQSKHRPCR